MIRTGRRPRFAADCARHRPALLDLVLDPGAPTVPPDARDHLEQCAACRSDVGGLALIGVATGRALADPASRPSADAWPSLRARLLRQRGARTAGRAASSVLGGALAAGLVIAILVPFGIPAGQAVIHEAGVDPAAIRAAGQRDAEDEARQLRATVRAGKEARSDDGSIRARVELLRYEAEAVPDWRVPERNPLSAYAR